MVTGLKKALLVLSFFLASISLVSGCSCVADVPLNESINSTHTIFAGEVTELSRTDIRSGYGEVEARFDVSEMWKGFESEALTVSTASNSAACGYSFEEGEEYLVYASESDGELRTTLCSRTSGLSSVGEEELSVLDRINSSETMEPVKVVEKEQGFLNRVWNIVSGLVGSFNLFGNSCHGTDDINMMCNYDTNETWEGPSTNTCGEDVESMKEQGFEYCGPENVSWLEE